MLWLKKKITPQPSFWTSSEESSTSFRQIVQNSPSANSWKYWTEFHFECICYFCLEHFFGTIEVPGWGSLAFLGSFFVLPFCEKCNTANSRTIDNDLNANVAIIEFSKRCIAIVVFCLKSEPFTETSSLFWAKKKVENLFRNNSKNYFLFMDFWQRKFFNKIWEIFGDYGQYAPHCTCL